MFLYATVLLLWEEKRKKKENEGVFCIKVDCIYNNLQSKYSLKKKKKNPTTDGQIKWDVNEENVFSEHIIKGALCKFGQKKKDKDLHCLNFFFMPKLTK